MGTVPVDDVMMIVAVTVAVADLGSLFRNLRIITIIILLDVWLESLLVESVKSVHVDVFQLIRVTF